MLKWPIVRADTGRSDWPTHVNCEFKPVLERRAGKILQADSQLPVLRYHAYKVQTFLSGPPERILYHVNPSVPLIPNPAETSLFCGYPQQGPQHGPNSSVVHTPLAVHKQGGPVLPPLMEAANSSVATNKRSREFGEDSLNASAVALMITVSILSLVGYNFNNEATEDATVRCGPGQQPAISALLDCESCPAGHFSSKWGQHPCAPCKSCGEAAVYMMECSAFADALCVLWEFEHDAIGKSASRETISGGLVKSNLDFPVIASTSEPGNTGFTFKFGGLLPGRAFDECDSFKSVNEQRAWMQDHTPPFSDRMMLLDTQSWGWVVTGSDIADTANDFRFSSVPNSYPAGRMAASAWALHADSMYSFAMFSGYQNPCAASITYAAV
eukprot:SAG31_NODE_8849_length_1376_cov_1.107283_1_plen_383_part_10